MGSRPRESASATASSTSSPLDVAGVPSGQQRGVLEADADVPAERRGRRAHRSRRGALAVRHPAQLAERAVEGVDEPEQIARRSGQTLLGCPRRSSELEVQPRHLGQQPVLVERLEVGDGLERVDARLGRDAGALARLEDLAGLLAVRGQVGRERLRVDRGELGELAEDVEERGHGAQRGLARSLRRDRDRHVHLSARSRARSRRT